MIQTATTQDQAQILNVAVASGLFTQDEIGVLTDMLREHFGPNDTNGIWLADQGPAGVVAVAYLEPERMTQGTFNLLMIAVHPDQQKQGRGSAMLRHVESLLADRGARILLVETMGIEEFDYVRAFYRKAGFQQEARIRDYYQAGADKIIFWKAIA